MWAMRLAAIGIFSLFISGLYGQGEVKLDSNSRICPADSNYIQDDQNLSQFFKKLDLLKEGKIEKVHILHIGDSHIQGDYMSRTVRFRLQDEFGEGGRGMVFPYSLLNMYGPVDYKCVSNSTWDNDRIFPREKKFPVGLVGYALSTNNLWMTTRIDLTGPPKNSWGSLSNFNNYPTNEFDVVKVVYSNDSNDMPLKVSAIGANNTEEFVAHLPQFNGSNKYGFQIQSILFDRTYKSINLSADTLRKFTEPVQLYGLIFENSKRNGIVYHMAGVGACQLNNFLKSTHFLHQTISLQPQMIIISLGANESVSFGLDTAIYVKKYIDLIQTLKKEIPGVSILLTTPPDILYKNKLPVMLYPVRRAIYTAAKSTNCAVWDLHRAMGGERSNYIWSLCKFAGPDRIHFTPKGYDFQGLLLTEALFGSYNKANKFKADTIELKSDLMEYRVVLNNAYLHAISKNSKTESLDTIKQKPLTPKVKRQKDTSTPKYHVVKRGETVYSISRKYDLNFNRVLKINGLTEISLIRPGQKIKIR